MIESLIPKYANKGLLIDTNILLLYLVGAYNPGLLARASGTFQYTEEDFTALCHVMSRFNNWIVTTNILTEASDLSGRVGKFAKQEILSLLSVYIGKRKVTNAICLP